MQKSLSTDSERLFNTASHVFHEKRKLCFLIHVWIACIQTALHELAVYLHVSQGSKHEENLRWNSVTRQLLHFYAFLK